MPVGWGPGELAGGADGGGALCVPWRSAARLQAVIITSAAAPIIPIAANLFMAASCANEPLVRFPVTYLALAESLRSLFGAPPSPGQT
jgi:hypothetical protein